MTSPQQEHRLTLTRESERRTADNTLHDQLDYIAKRALAGNRGRGWAYEIGRIEVDRRGDTLAVRGHWVFSSCIRFYRKVAISQDKFDKQLADILEWASAAGHNSRFNRCPWVAQVGAPVQAHGAHDVSSTPSPEIDSLDDTYVYTPLAEIESISRGNQFSHLFGLDSQVEVLLSALQAAADSSMHNRFHSLLWGDPGCGKTEILQGVARLLRKLGVNHLLLDATSTTEAGMRKNLLDDDVEPPDVILIEEIEKVPEASLRWLLGIMDVRATISQANYRKTASRRVPAIVLATANDMEQLRKMMYGALHSRFQHEIHCPRPGREILAKILEREVGKVGGDGTWIEPTIRFCFDEHGMTDPRKLIPVCLCGKDKLVTGEYQIHLLKTMGPQMTRAADSGSLSRATVDELNRL